MVGFNAFIVAQSATVPLVYSILMVVVGLLLSLYAIALIVNRGYKYNQIAEAIAKGEPATDDRTSADRGFFEKFQRIASEREGALFYVLLVFFSWFGALSLTVIRFVGWLFATLAG